MRQNESGNVFFYIFVCIALLAALSFAVSQGGRSSVTTLTEDRQRLVATEIIAFGDIVGKATTQLRLRGVAPTALSFASTFLSADYGVFGANPANEVFNPAGGAVVYHAPPEAATRSAQQYLFLANNEVENIGTTCGGAACMELLLVAADLRPEVCIKINVLLGVDNPGDVPPTDTDFNEDVLFAPGADPFNNPGPEVIGDEDTALSGQREGCFAETGEDPDEYIYYKVLLPR